MFDTLSRNIISGKTNCVVEHLGAENSDILVLLTKQEKGELVITETITVSSVEKVKEAALNAKAAHLIVNNDQVLLKTADIYQDINDLTLVNKAFPNIELAVFYYEIIRTEKKAFIYICRKNYVDDLITAYEDKRIFITQWSLGVCPLIQLLPYAGDSSIIKTPMTKIFLEDGEIIDIIALNQQDDITELFDIEGLTVLPQQLNCLGAVIGILKASNGELVSCNYEKEEKERQSNFRQHRYYQLGLPFATGVLLIIFLINFLFYNHYYQEVSVLNEISDNNLLQKEFLVKKDSVVTQKEKLFEDVIKSSSSSSSYVIDQVIKEIPETILLDKLGYHPLLKKIKDNKPIILENNTITISGVTVVNNDLSAWITDIERLDFVKNVAIKDLQKKQRNTLFTLDIQIKNQQ